MTFRKTLSGFSICTALLVGLLSIGARHSRADAISFGFGVCEDAAVVADPDDAMAAKMAAWQTQHTLMVNRNMPFIELRNTSETASISTFSMTIGDASNNFDFASLFSASPGMTFTVTSPDNVQNGARGDVLNISFTGFAPGNYVRFQIDIDRDTLAGDQLPDYRNVLFDVNGSSSSDNSVLKVTFSEPGLASRVLTETLPDFVDNKGLIFVGAQFRPQYGMDHVSAFTLGSAPEVPQVPEPSSLALLGCGAFGLGLGYYRRRASRNAK